MHPVRLGKNSLPAEGSDLRVQNLLLQKVDGPRLPSKSGLPGLYVTCQRRLAIEFAQ